jgi:malate synthase
VQLADGGTRTVTREWVQELMDEEFAAIERSEGDRFDDALTVFAGSALAEEFPDFLTLPAYRQFLSANAPARQELAGTRA